MNERDVARAVAAGIAQERERLARLVETQEVQYSYPTDDAAEPDIGTTLRDLAQRIRSEP